MIKITISHQTILITGHEQSNEKNKLVCAAISAISLTGINCFKQKQVHVISKYGYLKAKLLLKSYKNLCMWKMLINQLYFIYKTYPSKIIWKDKNN